MKKTVKLAALTLAAVLTLTACGTTGGGSSAGASSAGGSSANAASADTLRVVLNSEPSDLDPHKNTRLTAWAVQEEIFDKLVTKDEEGNIQPDLATSWTQIDDHTWQFKLRDDVTFHDGSKLTAADVVFSFQRACSAAGSKTFFVQFDPDNMKQRVVIAIALACNPKLLIADEPTTALDVTIQAQVLDLMNDLKKKFNTSMILITHVEPSLPAGKVGLIKGPADASTDEIRIAVCGEGGHGAHPYRCADPITTAGYLLTQLQTIISRENPAVEPVVLTFGMIQGGSAPNIIPTRVEMSGTLRAFHEGYDIQHPDRV